MLSGEFHSCLIDQIQVDRDARQRRDLGDLSALSESIERYGLIHPIVLTREFQLVAGERRLTAAQSLGWTSIPFQFLDELEPSDREAVELEENIRRQDLTWQELNDTYARLHRIYAAKDPEWNQLKTARKLGVDESLITKHLQVADERKRSQLVAGSRTFKNALRSTGLERKRRESDEAIEPDDGTVQPYILNESFIAWAPNYSGPKFNLLHCDFPYGINAERSGSMAVNSLGDYDDSIDVYRKLLLTLAKEIDTICAPSAHMIFWFSATHYQLTWNWLHELPGFTFEEYPLIWHKSDGKGVAPDHLRRPRREYEMAFFGWRGDRNILRCKGNIFSAATERESHPHEKSELMLRHFFEMLVDENTRLLDPTCGSGSALRAAYALGAQSVLGLEINEDFCNDARRNLEAVVRGRDLGI